MAGYRIPSNIMPLENTKIESNQVKKEGLVWVYSCLIAPTEIDPLEPFIASLTLWVNPLFGAWASEHLAM